MQEARERIPWITCGQNVFPVNKSGKAVKKNGLDAPHIGLEMATKMLHQEISASYAIGSENQTVISAHRLLPKLKYQLPPPPQRMGTRQ